MTIQAEGSAVVEISLDRLEALDLKRALIGIDGVAMHKREIELSAAGVVDQIATIAVPVTIVAIQALIVWLAKHRTSAQIEQSISVRHADGSVETRTIRLSRTESELDRQTAEIIRELKVPTIQ